MLRFAFFTSTCSRVLDYLLLEQKQYAILLVDFSVNGELNNAVTKSSAEYIKFHDWKNLKKAIPRIDIIISYKLPFIVPNFIIKIARYGAFNIHPSLLPKYRGLNPWYAMYYDGELQSGVTIHRMSSTPDKGNIIIQHHMNIEFGEPLPKAILQSEKIAIDLLKNVLNKSMFKSSGIFQPVEYSKHAERTIDSIRNLPVKRMWHLFRGFPSLLNMVFPELPHKYFEVEDFCEKDGNDETIVSDDFSHIETKNGIIKLIDFSILPMASDYVHAIEQRSYNIANCQVRFERDSNGQLTYKQGAEAIVFTAIIDGERKIVRFRKDLTKISCPNYVKRMEIIRNTIVAEKLNFFVGFQVVAEATIMLKGYFPALIMEYVNGCKLSTYLQHNLNNKTKLNKLLHEFERIFCINNSKGIVHGDLNDNNIIIDEDGDIKILDVDNLWKIDFDEQKDFGADKMFQHPLRHDNKIMCSYLDYFSQIIILANIKVALMAPKIYLKYIRNGNIFTESDYNNPQSSSILLEIRKQKDLSCVYNAISEALYAKELSSITPFNQITDYEN